MNMLEEYKKLSINDKKNLEIYCIYNNIYDSALNNDFQISDDDAMSIQEFSYQLYLDDEYYHLSASEIAYFLTDCYAKDKEILSKLSNFDDNQLLEAVYDYNLNFYKEQVKNTEEIEI